MGNIFIDRKKSKRLKIKFKNIRKNTEGFFDSAFLNSEKLFKNIELFCVKNKKVILGIFGAIIFLALADGVWFELSNVRTEIFVIKSQTIPTKTIVAGLPVRLVTLVDAKQIKVNRHYVEYNSKKNNSAGNKKYKK